MWIIYDTVNGRIKAGPYPKESDASRIFQHKPNQAILETDNIDAALKKRKQWRVDLTTTQLRLATQQEIDDETAEEVNEEQAVEDKKNNVRENKGQGNAVPDLVNRLDELIEVLQDTGVIPK